MLHLEFAIAPDQIRTLADLKIIEARFGFEKGALLSCFPKKWFKEVLHNLSVLSQNEQKSSEERLRRIKESRLIGFGRQFEGTDWADSAKISHGVNKFHRIIDQSFDNNIDAFRSRFDELEDADFLHNTSFKKDALSLALAAKALLTNAEKVTIYDPYICLTKEGYKKTLIELMKLCKKTEVDFHIFSEEDGKSEWEIRRQTLAAFNTISPKNIKLHWYCVDDNGSKFLHPRGLFTGKGGLIYDKGFCEPADRDERKLNMDITPMPLNMLNLKAKSYNTAQQYIDFKLVREVWHSK